MSNSASFGKATAIGALMTLVHWRRAFGQDGQPSTPQPPDTEAARDLFSQILGFVYTLANWLGQLIVNVIEGIIPGFQIPSAVVDPIGVLAVITVLMLIAEVSRKLIWLIISLGWILIIIRLLMEAF